MSSPTISDNSSVTVAGPAASFTRTLTATFNNNTVYILAFNARSSTKLPTVASVVVNGAVAIPMATPLTFPSAPGQFSTTNLTSSLWGIYNVSGSTITNPVLSVALTDTFDNIQYAGMCFAGLFDPTKPLDPKGGRFHSIGTGSQNITVSTTNADDTLLFFGMENSSSGFTTVPPAGWTNVNAAFGDPDSNISYKTFSSPQSNLVVATGQRSDSGGICWIVSLTADAGGTPLTFCGSIPNPPV